MSHDDFEDIMEKILHATKLVYRAEEANYYNVSADAAHALQEALKFLEFAAEDM